MHFKKLLISFILAFCTVSSFAGDWIKISKDSRLSLSINDNIVDEYDGHIIWLRKTFISPATRSNIMKKLNLRKVPYTEKILIAFNETWTKIAVRRNIFYDAQGNVIKNTENRFANMEYIVPDSDGEFWRDQAKKIYDNKQNENASSYGNGYTFNGNEGETKIFIIVEQMPSFPGGDAALMDYIRENINYPKSAAENCVQGRVIVQFVVEKDGTISDANVLRSVDPSLDREAIRLVRSMPRWTPGKQDGQAVRVRYQVPVNFRLQ